MQSWKDFWIGIAVGAGALAGVIAGYFLLGFAPVAVDARPIPFEGVLAHAALHHSTEAAAGKQSPIEPTEANLLAGARHYRSTCAICHGLPGIGKTDIQHAMYPQPPALLTGKGVTDDPVGETHWVIRNGIRMTGMPSFAAEFSDNEAWQIALLLANAQKLPDSVHNLLAQPDSVPVEAASSERAGEAGSARR